MSGSLRRRKLGRGAVLAQGGDCAGEDVGGSAVPRGLTLRLAQWAPLSLLCARPHMLETGGHMPGSPHRGGRHTDRHDVRVQVQC